ncbi:MAG: hypothetical protein AAGE65_00940 [Planctomycetota bacterium]
MADDLAPTSLDDVLTDAWAQLHHAATTAKHGFHLPTLVTTPIGFDPSSDAPQARVVVLRHVDPFPPSSGILPGVCAHTDTRSPKAHHLWEPAPAAWVFYDRTAKLQVRLTGPTRLLTFDVDGEDRAFVEQRWNDSTLSSKRCYLAPHAPGTPADAPSPNLPPSLRDRVPEREAETEPGKANFAVIRTQAAALDVLHLHHAGHRRAAFTFDESGRLTGATWLEV